MPRRAPPMSPGPAPGRRGLLAAAPGLALALALAPPLARPALAQGGSPAAVVERYHAALLEVMRQADRLGPRGRQARLKPAMEAAFDLPAMTRIAIGPGWSRMTPAQQAALTEAFSDWSVATYASRFNGWSGESFSVLGESALRNGDRMLRTRIDRPREAPVELGYLMRESGGGWRIVDVYLTGSISELASRRSEFGALLAEGGPDRLAAELRARTARMLGG
ncbi:ABC transporter substrate-binding protein [Pseudoroseomonas sp. WGS1072]|uniref:ABC transporter substrate-binding protein n=1 Tax=Roseomonas sp. WGS1072 TaxID=3366816 RepID=UPI003BF2A5C5